MKSKSILRLLILTSLIISACNKENRFSKRFSKGEVWQIEYVKVNADAVEFNGYWHIQSDVDIYDSVPTLEWTEGAMDAFFEWQFQAKGKSFRLNYNQLCAEAEGTELDTLDYVGYNLTGTYNVEEKSRNHMVFTSSATLGYNGTVEIAIRRVK